MTSTRINLWDIDASELSTVREAFATQLYGLRDKSGQRLVNRLQQVGSSCLGTRALTEGRSDLDILVLPETHDSADQELIEALLQGGYVLTGSPLHMKERQPSYHKLLIQHEYTSLSKEASIHTAPGREIWCKLNVIVAHQLSHYRAFSLAQHVVEELHVTDRRQRVCIFQAILYGNKHTIDGSF